MTKLNERCRLGVLNDRALRLSGTRRKAGFLFDGDMRCNPHQVEAITVVPNARSLLLDLPSIRSESKQKRRPMNYALLSSPHAPHSLRPGMTGASKVTITHDNPMCRRPNSGRQPILAIQISCPWAVRTIISNTSWLEMEPMNSRVSLSATGITVTELSVIRCKASSTKSSEWTNGEL